MLLQQPFYFLETDLKTWFGFEHKVTKAGANQPRFFFTPIPAPAHTRHAGK